MSEPEHEVNLDLFLQASHPAHSWLQALLNETAKRPVAINPEYLEPMWQTLQPLEQKVLALRLCLTGRPQLTFREIVAVLGLSQSSVASMAFKRAQLKAFYRLVTWEDELVTGVSKELKLELKRLGIDSLRDFEVLSRSKLDGILAIQNGYLWQELLDYLRKHDSRQTASRIAKLIIDSTRTKWNRNHNGVPGRV